MMMTDSQYERAIFGPRDALLDNVLRRSLGEMAMPTIQIDDGAGRVLSLLTMLSRPHRALEIGTLFGYSTIHIARALGPDARLVSIELDAQAAELAVENVEAAGLSHVVDIVTADAIEYLQRDDSGKFDLVFIDGDKRSYPDYLKVCYPLLNDGGILIADDAFGAGDYTGETENAEEARHAITAYNRAVARAPHLYSAFVGTTTGMLVSVKQERS